MARRAVLGRLIAPARRSPWHIATLVEKGAETASAATLNFDIDERRGADSPPDIADHDLHAIIVIWCHATPVAAVELAHDQGIGPGVLQRIADHRPDAFGDGFQDLGST